MCREYEYIEEIKKFTPRIEKDGIGQCPYNPNDNTTAVYYRKFNLLNLNFD